MRNDFCQKRAGAIAAPSAASRRISLRHRRWRRARGEGHFGAIIVALFATRA